MADSPSLSARAIWIRLLLYPSHTLPTAASPVLVGIGLAVHNHVSAPIPVLAAFLASWLTHVGGVLIDNHELLRRHPEVFDHSELLQALEGGILTFAGLRVAIVACFGLAALTVSHMLSIGGGSAAHQHHRGGFELLLRRRLAISARRRLSWRDRG